MLNHADQPEATTATGTAAPPWRSSRHRVSVAVHPRRADGTGATERTDTHVTALNTAAMAASTSARRCVQQCHCGWWHPGYVSSVITSPTIAQVSCVVIPTPASLRADLAALGVTTSKVLLMTSMPATGFSEWLANAKWMTVTEFTESVRQPCKTAWQAQLCLANDRRVLAFPGDGRVHPQSAVADIGGS